MSQYARTASILEEISSASHLRAISADKNLTQMTPQQLSDRLNIINSLGNLKPTLNPDPLGFGQIK